MDTRRYFWVVALAMGLSCGGDIGIQGPQGDPGKMGDPGVAPTGAILAFAGKQAPDGWLLCDGSEVDRGKYAALFSTLGVAYGPGNSVNTFNLPDLRGRAAIGTGQGAGLTMRSLGQKVGEETHRLTINEMPAHNHNSLGDRFLTYSPTGGRGVAAVADATARVSDNDANALMRNAGGDEPHNVMQPSLVLNHIIKY